MSKKYVRIWEEYFGLKLSEDEEIHHIDGNRNNNDISNLKMVTKQEHLEIHISQNDYGAAQAILIRMQRTPEENVLLSIVASKHQKQLYSIGKHNFQKISKNEKSEISRGAGLKTVRLNLGIHAINSNHELASKNGKYARSKLSRELELKMMRDMHIKIRGSKWWNNGIINKRSKERPNINYVEGMLKCK